MDAMIIDPFQFAAPGVFDADAADYIARVNAVDAANGASGGLEVGLQDIIHILFRDLKSDASPFAGVTNFAALKASCLLAGPRTRQGCTVPLLASMPTPTFQGTVGGWNYNRKTGLKGNGTNNYMDTNRSAISDSLNNIHYSIYRSEVIISGQSDYGFYSQGTCLLAITPTDTAFYLRHDSSGETGLGLAQVGMVGMSRNSSSNYNIFLNQSLFVRSIPTTSTVITSRNYYDFARNPSTGVAAFFSTERLSFRSIGEAVTLSTLNQRITAYMNALNALTLT